MTGVDEFVGNWTYRSFNNEPEIDAPPDGLLVAWGDLILAEEGAGGLGARLEAGGVSAGLDIGCGEISGQLLMGQWNFTLSGAAKSGKPSTIQFRATGIENTLTAGWIYDYVGYRVSSWPNGVGQLPTIVGSVIRTVPHEGAGGVMRIAGETLSFIAVSRDHMTSS